MHIVALNHVYWPDPAATAQLLTELCEGFAARGHAVTVLCRGEAGGSRSELRHGVRIERRVGSRLGKRRIWHRMADYASFHVSAAAALASLRPRPTVVLALTTPPLIAAAAQLAVGARGVPVVSVVQDLYPEVAFAAGLIAPAGPVGRALHAAAGVSLRASAAVVTLSEAMREAVLRHGVAPARLSVIPNWALAELEGHQAAGEGPEAAPAERPFTVMYSGNLGVGHAFDTVLAAAERLSGPPSGSAPGSSGRDPVRPVVFRFVGDGAGREALAREVAARGLGHVSFAPLVPREAVAASLASADLHLVTMRDAMAGLLEPSKLYGILAASRPFAYIGPPRTEADLAATTTGAGVSLRQGDVDGLVAWIEALRAAPDRGRALGAAGRRWLLAERSREAAVDAYLGVLREVA
jgi:colanic acid biosynthesis glycosyl transferase WcaI